MDNELLVKTIRELCKNRNIAISQLENDLNFGAGLISRWVKNSPSLDKIVDIANYFHVSIDDVVGYKQQDVFLNILYDLTNNKEIKWFIINKNTDRSIAIPHKVFPEEYYDEEIYTEKSYFTKYKEGYIIIYSFYENGKLINPNELSLYIQPSSDKQDYAWQDYSTTDLKPLWINILNNMDEIPVEVKAEALKDTFIDEFRNKSNDFIPKKKERVIYVSYPPEIAIDYVLKKSKGCILYDITNNKIIDQDKSFGITDIGKKFYNTYKESIGNIKQAKMFNGEDLLLLSSSYIMKLSGLSSGEQHGNIGYDGLLYVLKDAGFDISDESVIDKENFSIEKSI